MKWFIAFTLIFIAQLSYSQTPAKEEQNLELYIETGHSSSISSIAFSVDGKIIASAGDKTVKFWNTATGQEIRTFIGHSNAVWSVAFSMDGKVLASGGDDNTVKVWNANSGQEIRTLKGHTSGIRAVAFSPDSRIIASGGFDRTIRLWNAINGQELKSLSGHTDTVWSLAFSPDGNTLVSGGSDGSIKLWNPTSGQELKSLIAHSDAIWSVAFSPDGKTLAAPAGNNVRLWDATSGQELRPFEGHEGAKAVAFSSDGKLLASGGYNTAIKLWDVASRQERKSLPAIADPNTKVFVVDALAFSPDGHSLASASTDGMKLLDVTNGRDLRVFKAYKSGAVSVRFSPKGRTLAVTTIHPNVTLWNLAAADEVRTLIGDTSWVLVAEFSFDGKILASGSTTGTIKLWDAATGQLLHTLTGHTSVNSLVFSRDSKILASGSSDSTVRLWDVNTGQPLHALIGHTEVVRKAVAFTPDGKLLVSGSEGLLVSGSGDKTAKLWDVASGKRVGTFLGHAKSIRSVAISPDGKTLASASDDSTVKLWDLMSQREIRTLSHTSWVGLVAFSSDGKTLATFSGNNIVKLWDVRSGLELMSLQGNDSRSMREVSAIAPDYYRQHYFEAITPDQRLLIRIADSGRLNLFEISTGRLLASLILYDGGNEWVVATPEGRFDTNKSLDRIEGLHWIVNGEVQNPLSLDIFMRQYYEPGLLEKVLNGEKLKALPSIADINRVQTRVSIKDVRPAPNGLADVTVAVESIGQEVAVSASDSSKRKRFVSGAFDLRLFRDGQLVGYSTSDEKLRSTFKAYKNFDDELTTWRDANKVDLVDGKKTFTFTVKLPSNSKPNEVEFSAYAFNEDRVKSETARMRWALPQTAKAAAAQPRAKPRAYVIAVGVNANENPSFDLQFAANDARRFQEVLPQRLAATGEYSEVVSISLISDWEMRRGQKVTTKRDATKPNFKAVLDLLAGRPVADEIKRAIPNAEKLARTTPDDMVLILFSSHGFADQSGNFYFIPYDTGPGACSVFTETVRQRSISSDELSLWLRDVDAGQMTLIVDACYSTAAIEGSGFKPGPMGSRGLGQLAYDKRMRILTATQADNVAMELPATADGRPINHGLLSYALLEDGLGGNKADFKPKDKTIFMDEWLEYAVAEVPKLFVNQPRPINETQPKSKQRSDRPRLVLLKRELADPGACGPSPNPGPSRIQEQQPSLFDFTRRKREVPLVRNP